MSKKQTLYLLRQRNTTKYVKLLENQSLYLEDGVIRAIGFSKEQTKTVIRESEFDLEYVKLSSVPRVMIK